MAESGKFKVGDIVRLKSGGPKMTVKTYSPTSSIGQYGCQWFAGSKLEGGNFAEETLELAPAENRA